MTYQLAGPLSTFRRRCARVACRLRLAVRALAPAARRDGGRRGVITGNCCPFVSGFLTSLGYLYNTDALVSRSRATLRWSYSHDILARAQREAAHVSEQPAHQPLEHAQLVIRVGVRVRIRVWVWARVRVRVRVRLRVRVRVGVGVRVRVRVRVTVTVRVRVRVGVS